ncbi:MAG: carboxypeptidase regulatory-like domain-containing protein [Ktedonobacteraceae bacterium]|nr:carboxypeptidase regulatory-like domain-containing protein [Ktedonobacteraceae bacterium]
MNDPRSISCTGAVAGLRPLIFAITLVCLLFSYLPAYAAAGGSSGRISGRIINGTKHNAPVVGQDVTLQVAQGNTARDLSTVKTDAHGVFSFGNLDTNKTLSYAIYTRYQGAQYYTNLVDLSSKAVQQINLTVYEATTSSTQIVAVQVTVLMRDPDPKTGLVTLAEIAQFKNLGTSTYVGSLDASQGKPNALRFALPPGARHVSLSSGFNGYHSVQVERGFASDAALPPGPSEFAFSFEVPYTGTSYDFSYEAVYPTLRLSVLVPPTLHAQGGVLASKGLITANNRPYLMLQAQTLVAGSQVHAQIEGLPAPTRASNTSPLNLRWLWVLAGVLVLLAIVVVSSFLYRVTHREEQNSYGAKKQPARKDPVKHKGSVAKAAPTGAEQKLLQELLALDKSYEARKIKKADYEERRAKLKARLRTVMSESGARR